MRKSVLLPVLLALSACQAREGALARPAPVPRQAIRVVLDPGARVQIRDREGRLVAGVLRAPFARDSQQLVICELSRAPCDGSEGRAGTTVQTSTIRRLEVWGRRPATALDLIRGMVIGALAGGGIDGSWREGDSDTAEILAGGVIGGVVGALASAGRPGWIVVLPCGEGCMGGRYPRR
jgi:hypothetical protein